MLVLLKQTVSKTCDKLQGAMSWLLPPNTGKLVRFVFASKALTKFQTKLQTINHTTRLLRFIHSIMTPEKKAFIHEKYKGMSLRFRLYCV